VITRAYRPFTFIIGIALSFAATAAPEYDLTVTIDPATREFNAAAAIVVPPGPAADVLLGRRFEANAITLDGRALGVPGIRGNLSVWHLEAARSVRTLSVRWHGTLAPLDASQDERQVLGSALPVSGVEGTFLPAGSTWYPRLPGLIDGYRVAIDLPRGQRGVVPGRLIDEVESAGRERARFEYSHPAEGIDLMAGPYQVETRDVRTARGAAIRLRTYFHSEISQLASGYLDAVKGYLDLYEERIGPYPYAEFSIVSSPTPTGFGMPTLTYLGVEVLKLPFIRTTSLGHEILHNWWGNGVYPDYARGNWSEALTTFMADYAYKERESAEAGERARFEWLRDFASIPPGQDRPLAEFTARSHGTSQIVGYDKGAMVFVMLRDLIGAEAFERGVKRFWREHQFKVASWRDLEAAFEAESGSNLADFFRQWLTRTGAPQVRIATASLSDAGRHLHVTLDQTKPHYRLHVPIAIRTAQGDATRMLDLNGASASFDIAVNARITEVALDPEARLFRRLAAGEAPAILRQVMLDPETVTVFPGLTGAALDTARTLAQSLSDFPLRIDAGSKPVAGTSMLAIGFDADIDRWLAGIGLAPRPEAVKLGATATVWTTALASGSALLVVSARDAPALAALLRPLPHYGRESWLAFDGARMIASGVWPASPQRQHF
jgi:hypothetical protein